MRRDLNKPEVLWGIRIAASDSDAIGSVLPMNGGKTWLVITGLKAFLELMEASPSHREWAHSEIHKREAKPSKTVEVSFRVPIELYIRFNKLFPEIGASTWFIRKLVNATANTLLTSGPSLDERISMIVNQAMSPAQETSNLGAEE